MKTNTATAKIFTHEGAVAKHISAEQQLRRSVMSCMLWENEFYESGESIAQRIASLVAQVDANIVASIAVEARNKSKLRHAPLWIVRAMSRLPEHKKLVADTLYEVIQRADELAEFLSIYWADKKQPISAQVKRGLKRAFTKFDAYQLAKYNRDVAIKLRDVLFLVHAKPKNAEQVEVFKKLADNTLESPDTWEVNLSAGANVKTNEEKKVIWAKMLAENKLLPLALLRNLRNMLQVGVNQDLIRLALHNMKTDRILPFRFVAAANAAPMLEDALEEAMFKCLQNREKLLGRTVLLVDVSGSMSDSISSKSDMKRSDAASGLAILARELCEDVSIYAFSQDVIVIPPRRGFALRDKLNECYHGATYLGNAIREINLNNEYDRIIVITDEQSQDRVTEPRENTKAYMINVASAKNGVGYYAWTHIDGWSESVFDFIAQSEKMQQNL